MRSSFVFGTALVAIAAQSLLAHGPQIQITGDTGKIVTRAVLPDAPFSPLTAPKSAYVIPVKEHLGVWYTRPNSAINAVTMLPAFYSGPGIAYGYGYNPSNPTDVDFAVGSQIRLAFTDGLQLWNGAVFADAGSTELEAFRGSFTFPSATARTSDAAPFASIAYDPVNYALEGADVHNTTRFRLLGDGAAPTSVSPDGVYLATFQFTSDQQGMQPSDPFYFVLPKNASSAAIASAVAALNVDSALVQFVPEPSSATAAAMCIAIAALRNRRRRRMEPW